MNYYFSSLVTICLLIVGFGCSESYIRRQPGPSLELDFTVASLPTNLTFSRSSPATYFGSDGLLKTALANKPRFEHDPATLAMRGLLIEEQRTNLLTYSEQLDQWQQLGNRIAPNKFADPTGALTADLIQPSAEQGEHLIWQNQSTAVRDSMYTLSCFFKPNGYNVVGLFFSDPSGHSLPGRAGYLFDVARIQTMAIPANAGEKMTNPTIQVLRNGYVRCAFQIKIRGVSRVRLGMEVRPTLNAASAFRADGLSGGYVWGTQLEVGPCVTSYIPTISSAMTRKVDLCLVDDLQDWFKTTEGTWVAETVLGAKLIARVVGYDWPGNFIGISPNSQAGTESWNGYFNLISAGTHSSGIVRHGMAYSAAGRTLTREGLAPVTSQTPVGKVTKIALGANPDGSNVLNAHLRRVTYYPERLSDSFLQQATQLQ